MIESLREWISSASGQRLLLLAVLVVAVIALAAVAKRTLTKSIQVTTSRYKARKMVNMLSYLIIVLCVLLVYGDRLGSFGVTLGVAGAGVAFALQEVIISFAGWISITLTGSIKVGQRVKIGDIKGDIIDIGVMSTTIMEMGDWVNGDLYNGRIVSVANSFVFKTEVHNYSSGFPFLWDEIVIPIRTSSDHDFAKATFTNILNEVCGDYAKASEQEWVTLANKFNVEEARVHPMVHMSFDENWISFTLRYIVDYKARRTTKDLIYSKALDAITKNSDKIGIASGSIEVTQVS